MARPQPYRAFVTFQIPIVDLRPLLDTSRKLSCPNWPFPRVGEEFVRRFGGVEYRRLGVPSISYGEEFYCAIPPRRLSIITPASRSDGIKIEHFYSRIFGTKMGFRLDFGFRINSIRRLNAATITKHVLNLHLNLPNGEVHLLSKASIPLSNLIAESTTPTDWIRSNTHLQPSRASKGGRIVYQLTPALLVERVNAGQGLHVEDSSFSSGKMLFPIYEVSRGEEYYREARNTRAAIWRLHYEAQLLTEIIARYRSDMSKRFSGEALTQYLEETSRLLLRKTDGKRKKSGILAAAMACAELRESHLVQVANDQRATAKGLARRIDRITENIFQQQLNISENNYFGEVNMSRDKISIKDSSNAVITNRSEKIKVGDLTSQSVSITEETLAAWDELLNDLRRTGDKTVIEVAEELDQELQDSKRPTMLKRFWDRLRDVAPVASMSIAAANVVASAIGG